MIKVDGLAKRYKDVPALNGISFEVSRGQTFGLLGPNGAGKTTAISILCGLVRADGGTVALAGQTDPTRPEVRRVLGLAPQSLAIYEDLSAQKNLEFFARLYGYSGKNLSRRVDFCLDVAQLTERRRHRVGTFSGGMKRRLNLACALLHEPDILLLDEPTVGVDPQSRNLIFDTIDRLKEGGATILYTTHYMEEAERLCDRVAIVDHGLLLDVDRVDALIENHGGLSHISLELSGPVVDILQLKKALGDDSLTLEDQQLRFKSLDPMEALSQLQGLGLDLHKLRIDRASLEDVFLNLTGRRLRDS
ncbi:MAG: ABC transporter ATP-binding protein [Pontiellaceae bacterium]|nr:ABC transporter ATP-binding protein [Pontiellaceae bacterium]MBN2784554.1 ABC transporter ATP-binding protein [Pontiellaceae bacterium]